MKKILVLSLFLASTTACYAGLDFSSMILEDRDINQVGVYREQRMLKTKEEYARESSRELNQIVNENRQKAGQPVWRHPYKNTVQGYTSLAN